MATILDTLRAINAYPIPQHTFEGIATKRQLNLNTQVTTDTLMSRDYRLATADLYIWLADCPNISQGGQNYSFSDEQRRHFRSLADAILQDLGIATRYGYKGTRL